MSLVGRFDDRLVGETVDFLDFGFGHVLARDRGLEVVHTVEVQSGRSDQTHVFAQVGAVGEHRVRVDRAVAVGLGLQIARFVARRGDRREVLETELGDVGASGELEFQLVGDLV